MFKKILVCLDGSHPAEQIVPYAAEAAQRFGSKLILLEVTKPPSVVVESMTGYYHPTSVEDILRDEKQALDYLEKIAQRLSKKGLEVDYVTVPGSPGETIVSYAEKHQIGLIALSTHGHSGLGRLVFGSVAEHVLRHSNLPILVRKPHEVKG